MSTFSFQDFLGRQIYDSGCEHLELSHTLGAAEHLYVPWLVKTAFRRIRQVLLWPNNSRNPIVQLELSLSPQLSLANADCLFFMSATGHGHGGYRISLHGGQHAPEQ